MRKDGHMRQLEIAGLCKAFGAHPVLTGVDLSVPAGSLTAIPTTARAGGPGTDAAIGLGILGGVLAGAAIAATAPPVYAAPPSYYYPQQGFYYNSAPGYYYAPQTYYGSTAYSYPYYNYNQ